MALPSFSGIVYIQSSGNDIQYSPDDATWTTITSWPATITNSDSPNTVLKVIFHDITISPNTTNSTLSGRDVYFICGSQYIQFGDTSLRNNGTRPTITISGVTNYPGLIKNSTVGGGTEFSNISIYNLIVDGTVSGSTLVNFGGWICQVSFAQSSNNIYIINCSSKGDIPESSGGIIGNGCATNSGSFINIIGCSSSGNLTAGYGGGIIGSSCGYASANTILINQCYSTGNINTTRCGGIVGNTSKWVSVTNSYNTYSGSISGFDAGGIFGWGVTNCSAENCYSFCTNINPGGGIFGPFATDGSATNCYSLCSGNGANTSTTCYNVDGLANWNSTNATTALATGSVGTIWYSFNNITPFILLNFGTSPYVLNNITSNTLVNTASSSVQKGSSTSSKVVPEYTSFSIISSPVPTDVSIDSASGAIRTAPSTPSGTYALTIYALGSYTTTTYNLTVTIPCFLEGSTLSCLVDGEDTELPIEKIRKGTLVKTLKDGYKKVALIGSSRVENPADSERTQNRLYKLTKEKYPELKEDLFLTGCHSILVDNLTDAQKEETIKQLELVCVTDKKYRLMANIDDRAEPWASEGTYTVWHLALECEDDGLNFGVYANGGLLVETCSIRYLKNKSNMTFH